MGRVNRVFGSNAGEKICGAPVNRLPASLPAILPSNGQAEQGRFRPRKPHEQAKPGFLGLEARLHQNWSFSLNPGGLDGDQCVEVMFQPWENRHEDALSAHNDTYRR